MVSKKGKRKRSTEGTSQGEQKRKRSSGDSSSATDEIPASQTKGGEDNSHSESQETSDLEQSAAVTSAEDSTTGRPRQPPGHEDASTSIPQAAPCQAAGDLPTATKDDTPTPAGEKKECRESSTAGHTSEEAACLELQPRGWERREDDTDTTATTEQAACPELQPRGGERREDDTDTTATTEEAACPELQPRGGERREDDTDTTATTEQAARNASVAPASTGEGIEERQQDAEQSDQTMEATSTEEARNDKAKHSQEKDSTQETVLKNPECPPPEFQCKASTSADMSQSTGDIKQDVSKGAREGHDTDVKEGTEPEHKSPAPSSTAERDREVKADLVTSEEADEEKEDTTQGADNLQQCAEDMNKENEAPRPSSSKKPDDQSRTEETLKEDANDGKADVTQITQTKSSKENPADQADEPETGTTAKPPEEQPPGKEATLPEDGEDTKVLGKEQLPKGFDTKTKLVQPHQAGDCLDIQGLHKAPVMSGEDTEQADAWRNAGTCEQLKKQSLEEHPRSLTDDKGGVNNDTATCGEDFDLHDSQAFPDDGNGFEMDVTESQLCAVADNALSEGQEDDESRRRQQQDGERLIHSVLNSLLSLNEQILRTRQQMEAERRTLQTSRRLAKGTTPPFHR